MKTAMLLNRLAASPRWRRANNDQRAIMAIIVIGMAKRKAG